MPTFSSQRGISLLMWKPDRYKLNFYVRNGNILESSLTELLWCHRMHCINYDSDFMFHRNFHYFACCMWLRWIILFPNKSSPWKPPHHHHHHYKRTNTRTHTHLSNKSVPPALPPSLCPFPLTCSSQTPAVSLYLKQQLWITQCDKLLISWNYLGLLRLSGLTSLRIGFGKPDFSLLGQKILHPDSFG